MLVSPFWLSPGRLTSPKPWMVSSVLTSNFSGSILCSSTVSFARRHRRRLGFPAPEEQSCSTKPEDHGNHSLDRPRARESRNGWENADFHCYGCICATLAACTSD